MGLGADIADNMQHAFVHQSNPYHQSDWQHHPQHTSHNQYTAQNQAAAAANAVAQQQHYGRNIGGAGQNGGNSGSLNAVTNGNGMNQGGPLGGSGGPPEHSGGSMIGPSDSISEDNKKVLVWISETLTPHSRELALLELSKKREQVPELALILWHSFGEFLKAL